MAACRNQGKKHGGITSGLASRRDQSRSAPDQQNRKVGAHGRAGHPERSSGGRSGTDQAAENQDTKTRASELSTWNQKTRKKLRRFASDSVQYAGHVPPVEGVIVLAEH